MKLHDNEKDFRTLITLSSEEFHIPESAIERDYYIVRALSFLSGSEYLNDCVFKGGTSLSKCFPGSIERFSEDIDLSYIPKSGMTNKQIERDIKAIECIMTKDCDTEIIPEERNDRNKSIWFWKGNSDSRIKLEIGSSVRPEPYGVKTLKTYIQEYLERYGYNDAVEEYDLSEIEVNVLNIERTFIDKIMSVKRHSICGTIGTKSRHIYDVVRLYHLDEIQAFLSNAEMLKKIVALTKQTDSFYLNKRINMKEYNPLGAYDFPTWKEEFMIAKNAYEHLHENLLYTDEKQLFNEAVIVFEKINSLLASIGE